MGNEKYDFTLQSSLDAVWLNIEFTQPVELDDISMRVIAQDCPEFLVPYQLKRVDDRIQFRYKLLNTTSYAYSERKMPKDRFIRLAKSLLEPFMKGEDWLLDYHYICVDERYVYLDKSGEGAYFIYVPEASCRSTDEEIQAFLKTLLDFELADSDFQLKLYKYFMGNDVTISGLYQILDEEGKNNKASRAAFNVAPAQPISQPVLPISHQPVGQPEAPVSQPAPKKPEAAKPIAPVHEAPVASAASDDQVIDVLFGKEKGKQKKEKPSKQPKEKLQKQPKQPKEKPVRAEKKGLFGIRGKSKQEIGGTAISEDWKTMPGQNPVIQEPVGQQPYNPQWEAPMMNGISDDGKTEIEDEIYSGPHMELVSSPILNAPSRIDLNFDKEFILIGRAAPDELAEVDIRFPSDFKRVSRRHARIERKGRSYYIIDLGSSNFTFIDGQKMMPNQPYQLIEGMEITFTDSQPVRYRVHI